MKLRLHLPHWCPSSLPALLGLMPVLGLWLSSVQLRADDPTFYLFSPAAGVEFTAPATLRVGAVAIDTTQGAYGRQVKFFANGQLIGTSDLSAALLPPILPLPVVHQITWSKVPAGDYEIVATTVRSADVSLPRTEVKTAPLKVRVNPAEPPKVWLEIPHSEVAEGKSSNAMRLRRSGPLDAELAVDLQFSGTATRGTDYSVAPEKFIFQKGSDRLSLALQTKSDNLAEGDESVIATVMAPPTPAADGVRPIYRVGEPATGKVVIKDVPPPNQPPVVKIDAPEIVTRGPDDTSTFTAIASDPDGTVELVSFVLDGIRIWSDANPPFSVTIKSLPVGTHTLYATAKDNRSASAVSSKIQIKVVAGLGLPQVLLSTDDGSASESDPTDIMKFTLTRVGDTRESLRVYFKPGGTAKQDVDYLLIPAGEFVWCPLCARPTLPPLGNYAEFPAGEAKLQFGARALSDALVEGAETLTLTVIQPPDTRECVNCPPLPPAYSIHPNSGAKGVIQDTPPPLRGLITWVRPGNGQRFDAGASIPLEVLASVNHSLIETVEFFANDRLVGKSEFPCNVCDKFLPPGVALRHGIVWSDVPPGDYVLKAVGIVGTTRLPSADRRIHVGPAPELPTITLAVSQARTREPNPLAATAPLPVDFILKRSGPTDHAIKVYYSVSGTARNGRDYAFLDGDATIAAGKATREFRLQPLGDNLKEPDETVVLALRSSRAYRVGDPHEATVLIEDVPPAVDPPPTATIAFLQPTANARFATAPEIALRVTTKDPGGYFSEVEFFADNTSIGVSRLVFVREPDAGTPLEHTIAWKSPAVGPHRLSARGKSSRGVVAAAEIAVTVDPVREEPPPLAHPADLAIPDFALTADEVGNYAGAWKKGFAWVTPPNPVPVSYVTRAGFLLRSGGSYRFNPAITTAPLFWVPAPPLNPGAGIALTPAGDPVANDPAADPVPQPPVNAALAEIFGISASSAGELKIRVTLAPETKAWAIEETVGPQAIVGEISEGGQWDPVTGIIRWGPFFDTIDRTLTVQLTRELPLRMTGVASFDGLDQRIPHQLAPPPLPAAVGRAAGPRIASVSPLDSGAVQLLIVDDEEVGCDLEVSSDLLEWETIGQMASGRDCSTHLDTDAAESHVRFYRVVRR